MAPTRTVCGFSVPSIFYGTAWKEERTTALVEQALAAGFRALDTANQRRHYFEAAVGEALAHSGIARAELFLQTKFTSRDGQDQRLPYDPRAPIAEQVQQSFASSLDHLRTDYIDSLVLHGPAQRDRLVDEDWQVWRAMTQIQRAGKTRLVGVSNVSSLQLVELCRDAVKPAFVQNRCYAHTGWDAAVRQVCRAHDIVYQGFSLLTANRRELAGPEMRQIAARHGRTIAQVVLRFATQIGMVPLTGTSSAEHMRQDLDIFAFTLDDEEMATIERIAA
jgi:diketogulonate reductase-like aldo/keto reductase